MGRTNREGALLDYSCRRGSYYSGGRTNRGGRSNRGSTVNGLIFTMCKWTENHKKRKEVDLQAINKQLDSCFCESLYLG